MVDYVGGKGGNLGTRGDYLPNFMAATHGPSEAKYINVKFPDYGNYSKQNRNMI